MQKTVKLFTILLAVICILMVIPTTSEASWAITNPELLDPEVGTTDAKINEMAGNLLGVLQVIGSIISIIVLIILGIKYMIGSASEKAEYKKTMIPYLIGAVIIFSGTNLPKLIYIVVQKIG